MNIEHSKDCIKIKYGKVYKCRDIVVEALNRTVIVYAVQDSRTHVSVYPVGATMDDWIKAGSSSRWTQAVKSVVTK